VRCTLFHTDCQFNPFFIVFLQRLYFPLFRKQLKGPIFLDGNAHARDCTDYCVSVCLCGLYIEWKLFDSASFDENCGECVLSQDFMM